LYHNQYENQAIFNKHLKSGTAVTKNVSSLINPLLKARKKKRKVSHISNVGVTS
jgi:hypothetical protein